MLSAAADEDRVVDRPEPRVRFREFGANGLNLELLCWVPNPALRARIVHHLIKDVYERFQVAGIEIPYPQRDVTVRVADDPGILTDADVAEGIGGRMRND